MGQQQDSPPANSAAGRKPRTALYSCVVVLLIALTAFVGYQATHRYRATTAAIYHELFDRFRNSGTVTPIPAPAPIAAPTNVVRRPVPLEGPVASVFALFDGVDLYHKNGLVEVYGADLRQRKAGAIRVSQSIVHASDDRAYVFWSPDYSPARGATHLEVRLHDLESHGQIKIGIMSSSGMTYLFDAELGAGTPPAIPKPLPPLVPEVFAAAISKPNVTTSLARRGDGVLSAELPAELQAEINVPMKGDRSVATFFLIVDRAAGVTTAFDRIALVKVAADPKPSKISLAGTVSGAMIAPGAMITLLTDSGEQLEQQLSLDNTFRFEGIRPDQPVSLRFKHNKRDYYSEFGRWFVNDSDRDDLRINLAPLYVNPDGHPADATKAKFITPRVPSAVGAFYEPHSRQYWPGISNPQEFDSTTFANNAGFIDRDRFFDNPDNCVRFVHLGSSNSVALQVRPFENHNIVLESELGVLLQRCVEVISAGRDNGDIGSNYAKIRDYAVKFAPVAILLENSSSLVMQMHPELLRRAVGWSHEFNALDNFYYASDGKLRFRTSSPEYGLHAGKPDLSDLTPGIPLHLTLQLPFDQMHPSGKEAFKYLGDIMNFIKSHHPGPKFVIHTALDEVVQCRTECSRKIAVRSEMISAGASVFVDNHKKFCDSLALQCIFPQGTATYRTPDVYLTFMEDAHYSVLGHQWFAGEIARGLSGLGLIRKRP